MGAWGRASNNAPAIRGVESRPYESMAMTL